MRRTLLATLIAMMSVAGPSLASGDTLMSAEEVRRVVTQNRIYLATPLGGELPLTYFADGRVDGSGEAAGLGRFLRPSDNGRWWMSGNQLCQQWREWYKGRRFCFTLERAGGNAVIWRRDDGETGKARLSRR